MLNGTLSDREYHPAADSAMQYLRSMLANNLLELIRLHESFSSYALSGNRLAEVCAETLRRLMHGESVSDRYLLGLAWTIQEIQQKEKAHVKPRKKQAILRSSECVANSHKQTNGKKKARRQ